jgi:hypothetical protein
MATDSKAALKVPISAALNSLQHSKIEVNGSFLVVSGIYSGGGGSDRIRENDHILNQDLVAFV